MKTNQLLLTAALFSVLTSLSFAGPGIDYWNRMTEAAKNRTAIEAKAKADAPKPVSLAAACYACSCCAKKA